MSTPIPTKQFYVTKAYINAKSAAFMTMAMRVAQGLNIAATIAQESGRKVRRMSDIWESLPPSLKEQIDRDDASRKTMGLILKLNSENTALRAQLATERQRAQGLEANSIIQEQIIKNGYDPADKDKIIKLILENAQLQAEAGAYREALETLISTCVAELNKQFAETGAMNVNISVACNKAVEALSLSAGKEYAEEVKNWRELRPPVQWFAQKMEAVLKANDHKTGWLGCDSYWLMDQINIQMRQLDRAMRDHQDFKWVIKQCCDISNFAMMIADKHYNGPRAKEGADEQTTD